MKKKLSKVLIYSFLLGLLFLLGVLFIPRSDKVLKFKERPNTKYWELRTGSNIGYTKIEAIESERKSPIIYLHGGPGGMIKDNVIEVLKPLRSQGYDIYFYDQIGSGHSDRLKDIKQYSVKRHQKDLKEIVSIIRANKVILIGNSWGSCLAINYLQDYTEDVEKIILTGPGPILPINKAMLSEIPPDSLSLIEPEYSNKEGNEKAYNWRSKMILKWAYQFNSKLASDGEVDNFFTYLNQELSKSTDCKLKEHKNYEGGGGYYSHIMTVNSFKDVTNERNKLKDINIPILIIRGQCDNQKWGYTKEYLDLFKNSKLEIIGGVGHDIINGKREEYYKLISEFLLEK
jgi:proline iminopeptidase